MEELLTKESAYAAYYVLPDGTTPAEAAIIERTMQNRTLLEVLLKRQERLIRVFAREGVIPKEAEGYILNGSAFEREVGF